MAYSPRKVKSVKLFTGWKLCVSDSCFAEKDVEGILNTEWLWSCTLLDNEGATWQSHLKYKKLIGKANLSKRELNKIISVSTLVMLSLCAKPAEIWKAFTQLLSFRPTIPAVWDLDQHTLKLFTKTAFWGVMGHHDLSFVELVQTTMLLYNLVKIVEWWTSGFVPSKQSNSGSWLEKPCYDQNKSVKFRVT